MSPVSSFIFLLLMWGYSEGQAKHCHKHVQYLMSSMGGQYHGLGMHECCWCWSSHCLWWHTELCQVLCHSRKPHAPICTCTVPSRSKQQDNAPCHASRTSRTWLQEHSIQVSDWPAQSPDMSPIENLGWIIKRSVSKQKPKSLDELKALIQEEWDKITPQQWERLVGKMPARIRALLHANGRASKH